MAAVKIEVNDTKMWYYLTQKWGWEEVTGFDREYYQNKEIGKIKKDLYKKGDTTLPLKDAFSLEFSERILKLL